MRALPAIDRPWVVKVGGRLCEDRDSIGWLTRTLAREAAPIVLVHGGGDGVTRLQSALGLEPRFRGGRRVTSTEDLGAVEMALSGLANKTLVRALQSAGRAALGLSGCDAGLLRCQPIPGLGAVGRPGRADVRVLRLALGAGLMPVVSPVSLGPDGGPLNVNADEVASALACALGAERLLLLSDVEGVQVGEAWQRTIDSGAVEGLIASGQITGGMIPKLRSAAWAVENGVDEVQIGGFTGGTLADFAGTRVVAATRRSIERSEP